MRPKYIKKDKEALNDDKIHLISTIHEAKQENNKLKEKSRVLDHENQRLNKALKDLELYLSKKLGIEKFTINKQEVFLKKCDEI